MRHGLPTPILILGLLLLAAAVLAVDRGLASSADPGVRSDPTPPTGPAVASSAAPRLLELGGPPSPDADLAFETPELDLGRLEPGAEKDVSVGWRRTGSGPLRVRAVDTGCACVRGEGLPDALQEGATGALTIHFHGRSTLGPFVVFVRVVTDRGDDAVRRLRLRGFVGESTILDPKGLHVGDVRPGSAIERALALRPPPDRPVPPVQAHLLGLEGACDVGATADGTAYGVDVRVHAKAPEAVGSFVAEIDVRMGDVGFWRVPLLGRVVKADAGGGETTAGGGAPAAAGATPVVPAVAR
jgi:hypothetical protein